MNDNEEARMSRECMDAYGALARLITGGTRLLTMDELETIGRYARAIRADAGLSR